MFTVLVHWQVTKTTIHHLHHEKGKHEGFWLVDHTICGGHVDQRSDLTHAHLTLADGLTILFELSRKSPVHVAAISNDQLQ